MAFAARGYDHLIDRAEQRDIEAMVTRRSMVGALAGAASLRGKSGRKPNFLFLIADDHAGYVLGADGNKMART